MSSDSLVDLPSDTGETPQAELTEAGIDPGLSVRVDSSVQGEDFRGPASPTSESDASLLITKPVVPEYEPVKPTVATVNEIAVDIKKPTQKGINSSEASGNGESTISAIYKLSLLEIQERLNVQLNLSNPRQSGGLSTTESATRLARDGPNVLTPPKETPEFIKFLSHFAEPFMVLLMLAALFSLIAWRLDESITINMWIGIVLFVVVFISSSFAYVQGGKASAVMKTFKNMLPRQCHVVRDGRLVDMPAANLVVGDVIRVGTGDQCPADIRLIYCNDLKVEASSLTGESIPISSTVTSNAERIEDANNIVWNSCQCLEGEAVGVVFATGDNTLIGRIAKMASDTHTTLSTLQKEVKLFVMRLTGFSIAMGLIFFVIGIARSQPIVNAFINGFVVVLVANVPEGLPVTVVTILTITGKRLASLNVYVKQLSSVETLGSATVIASDKTGTLTQNKMSVSRLWFDLTPMTVDTVYRDMGPSMLTISRDQAAKSVRSMANLTLRALERVCAVNSRARFEDHRDLTDEEAIALDQNQAFRMLDPMLTLRSAKAAYPQFLSMIDNDLTINRAKKNAMSAVRDDTTRQVIGDASETALFNFIRNRQSVELARYHYQAVFEVPFNSRNKYALSIMKPYNLPGNTDHRRILSMKGAPEIILTKCNRYMLRGKEVPIDDEFREAFQNAYETFGGFGERVLGFAQEELDLNEYPPEMDTKYNQTEENYPTQGLVFLGLISLVDPPKDTVPAAIASCRAAGVRVIMVTGDHPLTAAAIARQVGIITTHTREEIAAARNIDPSLVDDAEVDAIVVRGIELDSYTEKDWDRVLSKSEVVFARTTPNQKFQIVQNLQRLQNIVAVTGDGVNDCVSIKAADIGIAMGISGSDVARDAADVILMDDDFGSIVVGIREGRTIFDNLIKTITYTVTHMVPEVIPVLLNLAFGLPLGLNAILILAIDIGTEMAPAISLAYEKAESDVMLRPPRNSRTDHLVTGRTLFYWYLMAGAWETLTCLLSYFLVFSHYGIRPSDLPFTDNYFVDDDDQFFCPGGWKGPVCTRGPTTDDCSADQFPGNVFNPDIGYPPDCQNQILAYAQSAYWVALVGTQFFHIWMCKTRFLSVFTHGLFGNMMMNFGVIIELTIIIIIVFAPVHSFFHNGIFPGIYWLIVLVGWAGIFILNEPRKWVLRNYPENKFIKLISW